MNYVVDSYENYKEENRLTTNNARRIEFVTTTRVLDEIIGTKSKILDCAAGTDNQALRQKYNDLQQNNVQCMSWSISQRMCLVMIMRRCMRFILTESICTGI